MFQFHPPISSRISTSEVITRLGDHGCQDLTELLDPHSCSNYSISSNGLVFRGKLLDGSQVAIKTMKIHINDKELQKILKHVARDLPTWSKCKHPNVVQLLGLVEFRDQIGMVSSWMENGNLPSYLKRNPHADRYQMSTEICEGLSYLHTINIVHGSLRGLNVLISRDGTPMLNDFGVAILQENTLQFTSNAASINLSPRWAAPELMEGSGVHNVASDVYALGMTILETISGRVPYFGMTEMQVVKALLYRRDMPQRPEDSIPSQSKHGDKLWSLLTSCWRQEPDKRPSADHVRYIMMLVTFMRPMNPKMVPDLPETVPELPAIAPDLCNNSFMSMAEVISRLGGHGCKDITDRLDLLSCSTYPISRGGFGDVYRGKFKDDTYVAIKTMRIYVNTDEVKKSLKNAARELHTWSKCKHPNVVQLLGLVDFRNQVGMVSNWMENGNLPSYLKQNPHADRYQMSTDICEGLSYLHAENIVHGDLKGLNVLISGDGTPMLTDFGNAIMQESTLKLTATTAKNHISLRWAAPELMKGTGMCSFSADVYALGMTILETMSGKVPYFDKPDIQIFVVVAVKKEHPLRPIDCIPSNSTDGDKLWSLLTHCWMYEPESRPSADHVRDIMKATTVWDVRTSVTPQYRHTTPQVFMVVLATLFIAFLSYLIRPAVIITQTA